MTTLVIQGSARYTVEQMVGENSEFRFYRVSTEMRKGQELLLKIGVTPQQNGVLDREAYVLTTMAERAADLERQYASMGHTSELGYQIGFPKLLESFVAPDQGGRLMLILEFEAAQTLSSLVPISWIRERDRVRVDPRTSAWIMGKLLKLIVFAHDQGIKVGCLTGENILIVRENHFVTISDWSKAKICGTKIPLKDAREDIRAAAGEVLLLLGGDPVSGVIPEHEQLVDNDYDTFLAGLARGAFSNAREVYSRFYEKVEAIWGRTFHPYTTFPL